MTGTCRCHKPVHTANVGVASLAREKHDSFSMDGILELPPRRMLLPADSLIGQTMTV